MTIGISPLVDFAFKLMLASRGHERVTIHFLNAILGELVKIASIVIQNPFVGPNFEDDKFLVLDILAEDEQGRKFNILLNAEHMTMEEIRELFPEPEFAEAAGVLEVIKNNPDQMDNYISRLKYQLDDAWRLESTRSEALKEGEQKGERKGILIGRIETLQELLGLAEPTRDELSGYDTTQLSELCEQLRFRMRTQPTE